MGSGGGLFDTKDRLTKDRLNQKCNFIGTGTELNAIAAPFTGMLAYVTTSGSNYVAGNYYVYTGSVWRPDGPFIGTGAEINSLAGFSQAYAGLVAFCTSTGSGFVVDTVYYYAGSAWKEIVDLSLTQTFANKVFTVDGNTLKHSSTNSAGDLLKGNGTQYARFPIGTAYQILAVNSGATDLAYQGIRGIQQANIADILDINKLTLSAGMVGKVLNMGGVNDDATNGGVSISSGTSGGAGPYGNAVDGGVILSFANDIYLIWKSNNSITPNGTGRIGVNMELVQAGGVGASAARKFGLEAVDTTGTSPNFNLVSADGTTRSTTATTEGSAAATTKTYKLIFTTGTNVKFYVNGTLNTTKSTNIPSSGSSTSNAVFMAGCYTNNGGARVIGLYGYRLIGKIGDTF